MTVRIEVSDAPTDADRQVVLSGLVAHNGGHTRDSAPLSVLVRDADGNTVGGLIGRVFAKWLYVELLWLPDALRGTGLGAEVIRRAEAEAARRGCVGVHLNTFSFQAPGFYERLGYEVFGTIPDHPPGQTRFFLRKRL